MRTIKTYSKGRPFIMRLSRVGKEPPKKNNAARPARSYAAFELFRLAFDHVFVLAVLSGRKACIPTVSLANFS